MQRYYIPCNFHKIECSKIIWQNTYPFEMQIITSANHLFSFTSSVRFSEKKSIGFVPTMGALHQGHLSLINRAKQENNLVICSVFINPTQFNNKDDFDKYPRNFEHDIEQLKQAGCDVVFLPEVKEMYPEENYMQINFGSVEDVMEGEFRKGHFNGVATIVSKLFHFCNPTKAYFGLKDLQQVTIIKQLVSALSFPLEIIACPTLREESGLAMSSRNERLSVAGKKTASYLYQSLKICQDVLLKSKNPIEAKQKAAAYLQEHDGINVEYLEITETNKLISIEKINSAELAICIAAYVENVRLIDNIIVKID